MKKSLLIILTVIPAISLCQNNLKLWYKQPAKIWTDALPVGNGRLGAMVFGGVQEDLIQLNEGTFWTGGPVKKNVNPGAYDNFMQARAAALKDDFSAANELLKKAQGYYTESYLPLGDLVIKQQFKDAEPSFYYRDLDISNATATTRFTIDGVEFTKQIISSAPDQVIVVHFTSNKAGKINLSANTRSLVRYTNEVLAHDEIAMKGKAPAHVEPSYQRVTGDPVTWEDPSGQKGMRFELRIKVLHSDGTVEADTSGIHVKNASNVTLLLSAATSFNGFDKNPVSNGKNESQLAEKYLTAAAKKNWTTLLKSHEADYQKYFNRVAFNIAPTADNENANRPTDQRLKGYAAGAQDHDLETLYFQYGRYLLISSSRPTGGGVNANLQGIWNKEIRPPWSANFTTNINAQMNYWPAEVTNLSEMHMPFIKFIKNAAVTGTTTAQDFYHARGWAVHHNSDIWALSNPVGDFGKGSPGWANWTMGSPWLSQHLWWHYEYTKDKSYLKNTAYPLMKSAALFCLDFMISDKDGYLITAPSVSPENTFIGENGKRGSVTVATTMDMEIIWDLFTNLIEASQILDTDKDFRNLIIAKRAKLYPLHIGKKGNLQEWYKDLEDADPHHRHISHLFGLYPGREISPLSDRQFADAAKKTLELRGDGGTGWTLAWKTSFWARLLDGNHAYAMIKTMLRPADQAENNYANGGGSYNNLFDICPPFQIDGNFGAVAGMSEMLMQSQLGEIYMLPALPDAWNTGEVKGLKARGNFEVSMIWKNLLLSSAGIKSIVGGICKIRTANLIQIKALHVKAIKDKIGYVLTFQTKKGKFYKITAI